MLCISLLVPGLPWRNAADWGPWPRFKRALPRSAGGWEVQDPSASRFCSFPGLQTLSRVGKGGRRNKFPGASSNKDTDPVGSRPRLYGLIQP